MRLEFARFAIAQLAPRVRAKGVYQPATHSSPALWKLHMDGLHIGLATNVLLLPTDSSTSELLDIWPESGRKIFSVSWHPREPWIPPRVSCFHAGEWMTTLGYIQPR